MKAKKQRAAKPRSKPVSQRTDWEKMKDEFHALRGRLRNAPEVQQMRPDLSVDHVLNAFLYGRTDRDTTLSIIRQLDEPLAPSERTDWPQMQQEIIRLHSRLQQMPAELKNRRFNPDSPFEIVNAFIVGDVTQEQLLNLLNLLAGRPISARCDIDQIRQDITALLARLQDLRGFSLNRIPFTNPNQVLLAHIEGVLSFEQASSAINEMIGRMLEAKRKKG